MNLPFASSAPFAPAALSREVLAQLRLAWRLRLGYRSAIRPLDWQNRGLCEREAEELEAALLYADWQTSALRSATTIVAETPLLALIYALLLAAMTGAAGTGALGLPSLFLPEALADEAWRQSRLASPLLAVVLVLCGAGVGAVLFGLCFIGCLISSREWMSWPGPINRHEFLGEPGPHRLNLYLSAAWSTLLTMSMAILLWSALRQQLAEQGAAWLMSSGLLRSAARGVCFALGMYGAGAAAWQALLVFDRRTRLRTALRAQGVTSAKPPAIERMVFAQRRLQQAEFLHPDARTAHLFAARVVTALLLFGAVGYVAPNVYAYAPTSLFVCALLLMAAASIGFLAFHGLTRSVLQVGLIVVGIYGIGQLGREPVEHKFSSIDYRKPLRTAREAVAAETPLLDSRGVVARWRSQWPTAERPRMVIVCTSGGGIRAATWTVRLLTQLETETPGFHRHVRIIGGASGGMLGAAYYVVELDRNGHDGRQLADQSLPMAQDISQDSLQAAARWLALRDVPQLGLRPALGRFDYFNFDRGQAVEQRWQQITHGSLARTFGDLRSGEAAGRTPSLIFSPMIVEDGRRLLVSNLDLTELTTVGDVATPRSLSAWQFGSRFPEQLAGLQLSAAARMSATFPYVTPAGQLPTEPPVHVVDAGYYDNYGVNIATNWLWQNAQLLASERIDVVIVQIRDGVEGAGRSDANSALRPEHRSPAPGLLTPIEALLNARNSVTAYNNDERLAAVAEHLRGVDVELNVVTFEFAGKAALSWHLEKSERQAILQGLFVATSTTDDTTTAPAEKASPAEIRDDNISALHELQRLLREPRLRE